MKVILSSLFFAFLILIIACNKAVFPESGLSSSKNLLTLEMNKKFQGKWNRTMTMIVPEFTFNLKDSANPGLIKFSDSIFINAVKVPLDKRTGVDLKDIILDSLEIVYPKVPGIMDDMDTTKVSITDSLTFTYSPLTLSVKYNTSDSTFKFVDLEVTGQGKRNATFNSGLILESGNLTLRNKYSVFIGFWNSYLSKYSN
jgi:hypothetical protein